MANILVVFGSKSDADVYDKIINELKKKKIPNQLRLISAHRTPDEIDNIARTETSLIIAGAGLSAALPGVIASKTIKPIIGVPVHSNYQGLDALLSIAQMPPGIPVMAVGVNKAEIAALNAVKMLKPYHKVNIIGEKTDPRVRKAMDLLKEFNAAFEVTDSIEATSINIQFVSLDEEIAEKEDLVIYCPMVEADDDKAEAAINFLKMSTHGLWVGLNRAENAALAAIQIMNLTGKFTDKLNDYRNKLKEKVIAFDKEVQGQI